MKYLLIISFQILDFYSLVHAIKRVEEIKEKRQNLYIKNR